MLVTLKEVLVDARKNHYAVPAFDCVEDVMVRAILETCQAMRSPVILMCLVGPDIEGNGWAYVSGIIKAVADYHDVPVVLHLDHCSDMELIQRGVEENFSSVMIDGSRLPFEENVELTKRVVELAHPKGISVEAELGFVGGMDLQATERVDSVLTQPQEVKNFIEQTEVDALAVSIGTLHGMYQSLPTLNIERLKEINAISIVPLVLHGGSGTPENQIQEAVRNGICKLNIYADCRIAMARGLQQSVNSLTREDPLPQQIFGPIKSELCQMVEQKIKLLFSQNRC